MRLKQFGDARHQVRYLRRLSILGSLCRNVSA
jgi:hypothetical protein